MRRPPLPEQRAIAAILATWDEAITLIERLIAALHERKRGLMQRLLTGEVRFPGFEDEWREELIGDICEIRGRIGWRGYTREDLRDSGPPVIGGTQISAEHKLDFSKPVFISEEKYQESPEIQIEIGDILMVKTGNTIGKTAFVNDDIGPATINPNTVILRAMSCEPEFLYYVLITPQVQRLVWDLVAVGAQPSVNQSNIKGIKVKLPTSLEEEYQLVEILKTSDQVIKNFYQMADSLRVQKKGLMQRLLTGEIRVRGIKS